MASQKSKFLQSLEHIFAEDFRPFSEGSFIGVESAEIVIGEISFKQADDLAHNVEQAYRKITHLITHKNKCNLWRCWNRIPRINEIEGDQERYKLFCSGRHHALIGSGFLSPDQLPAATAVGTDNTNITLSFIAAEYAGSSIENANQVSAYQYPKKYGRHAPSFARAYSIDQTLFISGTASIKGHESLHHRDLGKQLAETTQRLSELAHNRVLHSITAYVRYAQDMPEVKQFLHETYPSAKIINIENADICRQELLIEIEAIAQ